MWMRVKNVHAWNFGFVFYWQTLVKIELSKQKYRYAIFLVMIFDSMHELRTLNEGINQRYLKNWADVADKISFGRT